MKNYLVLVFLAIYSVALHEGQCANDVPAILWNIKGDSLSVKPVSAFDVTSKTAMDNLLKESLSKKSTATLVFLVDELSLEDFTSKSASVTDLEALGEFLDAHQPMLLPHVQNPHKCLHNLHCAKEEFHVYGSWDAHTLETVSAALDRSCIVILHMHNSDASTRTDAVKDVLSSLSTSKKNVIGMFTASKSSWNFPESQRKSRSLLAVDDSPESSQFFNYSDCIIMYATNITLISVSDEDPAKQTTVDVPFDYDLDESECNETDVTRKLVIKFRNVPGYSTLTVRMTFGKKLGSWSLTKSDLTVKNDTETEEHTEITEPTYVIESPLGFSYSCGKLAFDTTNATENYRIVFLGFQVQSFDIKDAFSSSFDCVPFFTIPIWMGLLVGLLFIIILNTGVYALFAVKTMDRFDDPKGKTISVAFSAD